MLPFPQQSKFRRRDQSQYQYSNSYLSLTLTLFFGRPLGEVPNVSSTGDSSIVQKGDPTDSPIS